MSRVVVVLVVLALGGALVPVASAAGSVTVGGLDPTANDSRTVCGYQPVIYVEGAEGSQAGSPANPPTSSMYIVPAGNWTVTSWSVSQQGFGAQIRLAVVSFGSGASALTVDAFSPLETISAAQQGQVVTFPADIPVKGGQEIALDGYGGSLQGCAYGGGSDQVDIADDGQQGTHNFGQTAYIPNSQVNIAATLQPASSTPTTTTPTTPTTSPPPSLIPTGTPGAGDARLKAAILAGDHAILRSSALRTLKRRPQLHSSGQRRRMIRVLRRLQSTLRTAARRVANTPPLTSRGRSAKRDWIAATRILARGLRQFLAALRQAGHGHARAASAELVKALKEIASAKNYDLRADSELGLPRGG